MDSLSREKIIVNLIGLLSNSPTVSKTFPVGIGRYPGLAIDGNEYPHICWISEYLGGYMLYHSKLTAFGWTTPDELLKAPKAKFTPASFDIDKEKNKAHLSWADFPTAGNKWYIYKGDFSLLDTTPKIIPVPYDSAVQMTPESPNYLCDQDKVEGYLLWEKDGDIYAGVEYESGVVNEIVNLSSSSDRSIHPNLSKWGDSLYAVWQEEYPFGNKIFFTKRSTDILSSWQEPIEIRAFPGLVEFPVCHGPYIFASGKAHAKANYDIYGYREDEFGDVGYLLKMTTTKTKSLFPALYFSQHFPKQKLFVIGTEDTTSTRGEIGWVFGKCVVEGAPPPIPIRAANLGSPDGSPYTVQREGYKVFGYRAYQSVDYHTEELKYRFTGLKPSERYRLKLVFNYREEGQDIIPSNKNWQFKVKVGGHPIGTVKIEPDKVEPTYFEKWIPKRVYQSGELDISIEKMKGKYTVCSEIFLYEYQKSTGGKATQISKNSRDFTQKINFLSPRPNPFTNSARFSFIIPREDKVSLKIYDASGRLCKTLVNKKLDMGSYYFDWDGKEYAAGLYFSVLKVGKKRFTRKIVKIK